MHVSHFKAGAVAVQASGPQGGKAALVRQFRADVSGTMDKITATGKLEPEMVDAILNAWKAYAGGDSHAVQ